MVSTDAVVIGAGMAGASVAAELAHHCTVSVVETERAAGVHSTGRSAASYLPSYGGSVVRRLTAASRSVFDELSETTGLDLLPPRPLLWVAPDATSEKTLAAMLDDQSQLEPIAPAQAAAWCPALVPDRVRLAALDRTATDVDVAALHHAYLAQLKRRGVALALDSPVVAVQRRGGGWRVRTAAETYDCATVVDAAGAWADRVAALAGVPPIGLQPKLRTVFHSPVRGRTVSREWPIVLDASERWYFKPEHPYLLASPADESDCDPCDAQADDLAIARAIEDINAITDLQLRSVRTAWAGLRSFVADRSPVVGAWPEQPGFHFLAGQGGYGIQMAPALARVAAAVVTGARPADADVTVDELAPARLRAAA